MMDLRYSILSLICFALLSTAAMARPADNIMAEKMGNPATPADPLGRTIPAMPSDTKNRMGSGTHAPIKFQGEILSVEGDLYTIGAAAGKEVQLHVDESTQQSGKLKEGDQIEAEVTEEGHALKLKKANGMK